MLSCPRGGYALAGADCADLIFLEHAHVLARFRRRDRHAVRSKGALQGGHRRETSEIHRGSGPIQNYRFDVSILQVIYAPLPILCSSGKSAVCPRRGAQEEKCE